MLQRTGCTTSYYHLIVLTNMVVLSCATHLLCIVNVQRYWKNPWIGFMRLALILAVFGSAGKLMTGGYDPSKTRFPSTLPVNDEQSSIFFLPSPCFMRRIPWLDKGSVPEVDFPSTGNRFLGWNMYVTVLSYTAFAVVVTLLKALLRPHNKLNAKPRGLRKLVDKSQRLRKFRDMPRTRLLIIAGWVYQFLGFAVGVGASVTSAQAIIQIRTWAQHSKWLEADGTGRSSDEQEVDSLGQILPLFSCVLVFFVLVDVGFNGKSKKQAV